MGKQGEKRREILGQFLPSEPHDELSWTANLPSGEFFL